MSARLDHLVVAAGALDGGRWIADTFGVAAAPGGRHETFGTHNVLLGLGGEYLELIAVDPDAVAPARPRWFGLDELPPGSPPRLLHWVVAVDEVEEAAEDPVLDLSRGANRWRLTVPDDGRLPGGGVRPSLIQWLTPPPASALPDVGVRLERLTLTTPRPDALIERLDRIGLADERVTVVRGDTGLGARFRAGERLIVL